MYNTSKNYKNYIKEPSRMFESKIVLGDRTITNSDVIQLKTELQQPSSGFTIGSCISKTLELTIKNDGGAYASAGSVNISLGLKMGELIEYIPQGIFNIDTVEKTDYTVKVTAYDNMIKFETPYSEKYENPTLKQVIQQLEEITKVEFDSSINIPNYTLSKIEGYTCREILGYVASLMGGNAYINRDGRCTIVAHSEVDYTITADNYFDYDIEDNIYKIGMLTCQNKLKKEAVDESDGYEAIKEKNTISAGSLGPENMELTFVNPWVTQPILDNIYNMLKDFSFIGYSMKWQGDLSLDVGNIINVTDRNGTARKAFIYYDCINYNGGLTQTIKAKGQTKTSNNFNPENAPTEIERISVKLLLAEKAIIDKANIKDLTAANANIGNLQASVATINTALIHKADIDDLKVANANISNLNAQYANLNNAIINKADIADLNAANANIGKLQASKADISALDATNASIGNLKATVGDIKTLVSGNLTSSNIHSLVLTADKVTVENGFIKNAMVESLVADKITSGTLNTNKLNIASNDGGLVLANNTIQFSDKDKNVRVQIGQDAKGGFNFIVKGTDGKTVLLDSTGLHEGAISDGLIKTDMIADNSINSNKIDYSSVISGLNKDGSNYINASKVAIDLNGQTLDVAFNSVKSSADRANSKIDDLSIGGRNLLLNSSFEKDLANWNGTGTIVNSMLEITGTDSSTRKTQNVSVLPSTQYTFSIELVDQTDTDSFTVFLWEHKSDGSTTGVYRDNNHTFIQTGRVSYTIKTQPDCAVLYVLLQANNKKTIHVKNAKLEKGNKATDWTPAPEDTDSAIENIKNITETNTTSIKAIQGQITTLISNTTVTIDGKEKTLKDAYSSTVQTVNSINTTIGEHTSKLNTLNGTVSSNSSKITSIQTDLNGIKTSVSSVQSDLNSTKSQLSSLSTTLDGFESRVETTENNLNNLSIGGRNYIKNSNFYNSSMNWDLNNGCAIDSVFKFNSHNTLKISESGLTSDKWYGARQDLICDCNQGQTYTASAYYYVEDSKSLDHGFAFEIKGKTKSEDVVIANYPIIKNPIIKKWTKINYTFTINRNDISSMNAFVWVCRNGSVWFGDLKLELGTKATDWSPAPEDAQTYTDTQISNAKSEIKQTTDSISQSVSNMNSKITTINNTLGNKAEKSTVENISNRTSTLETNLNSITQRVSSTESKVTTTTEQLNKVDGKIQSAKDSAINTASNDATNKINGIKVGGTNLLRNGNFQYNLNNWTLSDMNSQGSNKTVGINSSGDWCPIGKKTLQIRGTNTTDRYGVQSSTLQLAKNTKYTISGYCAGHRLDKLMVNVSDIDNGSANICSRQFNPIQGGTSLDGWQRFEETFTTTNNTNFAINLYAINFKSDGYAWFADVQLQEGTKATAWTPCNEDINSSIDMALNDSKKYTDGQVVTVNSTINNKIAEIKTTTDSINQSVSSINTSIKTINNTLGNKAEKSIVENINSSVTSLNTTLNGITGRVSSLETNTTTLTTKLNDLSIGGRNLLNDSGFELGTINKESVNGGILSIVTEDKYWGTKSMKVVTSSASNASGGCVKCSNLVVGTKYTASLLIKCTTSDSLKYQIMDSSWNTIVNSTNNLVAKTWTKISLTFTATETSCKVGVLNGTPKVITFYIDNIKLEKGNIPTDWTPAPEDTESEITTVKETVTSNSTEQGRGESNLRACREGDREEMHTDRHHGTFQKGQRVGTPRALGGEGRRAGKGCGRDGLTARVRNGALFLSPCFLFLLGTVPCSLVGKD